MNLLRELREGAKLSQRDLADKLGVTVSFISSVERGVKPLTPERIEAAAGALKLDDDERKALFLSFNKLPPQLTQHLLEHPELW
jgi:transcriptional regulator with XRE-family HTH domain